MRTSAQMAGVLAQLVAVAFGGQSNLMMGTHDMILTGGTSFVGGHGAPTGVALRTGSPGQKTAASFPKTVLAPGSKVTAISFSYRYIVGYESTPSGNGANLSLSVSDETLRIGGKVIYSSPLLTDYAYSHNSSNYSAPVNVHLKGLSIAASNGFTSRLQLSFWNNDRNLQILVPLSVNVTCEGADECFVAMPTNPPTPPPSPLPPTPPPPATNTPWKAIGPWNIGDDIYGGGEAGTIAPAVSVVGAPNIMYMGGNNNAASSGVLKTTDKGKHWVKSNKGLFDTRIQGLFIVDTKAEHVLVGTPSGVFETLNGAKSWTHVDQTGHWGVANSFRNGTIGGKKVIFVGANNGLGNVPLKPNTPLVNETWNIIPSPPGSAAWRTNVVSVADFRHGKPLKNSMVAGCLWASHTQGVVHLATIVNETSADWTVQMNQPCQAIALDPNNADHLIVNNASNGAHIYESDDGGKSYHGCLNQRGAVMVAIDRQGWFYCASEGGAFRNANGCGADSKWEPYFVRRIWRRNKHIVDRVPHDYQRISIDFAGGVAFGSDQGMFYKNMQNESDSQLISANGDVNNNIIMHPAVAEGEAEGEVCITTALWDWSPVASWDSGKHWPSWQTPDDGSGMGYFGEGGGCFGVGESKNVLCMHHHNVGYSSRCGKNQSRFVAPHGASVGPPEFARKPGSRSVPGGEVYAPMTMGAVPWDTYADKRVQCTPVGDLGVAKSYECVSRADIGLEYNWYPGTNVAIWRGDTDKHCYLCKMTGNSSTWKFSAAKGAITYALQGAHTDAAEQEQEQEQKEEDAAAAADQEYDENGKPIWRASAWKESWEEKVEKIRQLEWGEGESSETESQLASRHYGFDGFGAEGSGTKYVLKSFNFGANWTWIVLPDFLQGGGGFRADPTNSTVLYAIASNCIARSYDGAETWEYCWQAPGLEGSFKDVVIKDSKTILVMRNGAVPLRTRDGGKTWTPLNSLAAIARNSPGAAYSWSGKTLAVSTVVGQTLVWVSRDDGETWVDESGDYTAMSGGIAQWYDNTLYICSLGQGISAKTFKED